MMDGLNPACYNRLMKKLCVLPFILCVLLPLFFACKSGDGQVVDALEIEPTAPMTQKTPAPYGRDAGVKITASAAYVFEGAQGPAIYGAIEYENTGNCPIILSKAHFSFTLDSGKLEHDYVPPLGEYTIVLPGETSFATIWIGGQSALPGANISLTASLTVVEAAAPTVALEVDQLYVADNYPGFSTLSGRLSCTSEAGCSMNIVYVGFYDEAGTFLGAWYFTKNAVLEQGDAKNFVINMRDFPLSDLGARAASFKSAAFGFDL